MKNLFALFIALSFSFGAFAASPAMTLTPKTLTARLDDKNFQTLQAQIRMKKARLEVEAAKLRLLPSLNLGVLIGSIVNPTYLLSSVEYTLPFLIPQNWFNLTTSKRLQNAEVFAYDVTQLNLYASTYALVLSVQNDMVARSIAFENLRDAITLQDLVAQQVEAGMVNENDLNRARSLVAASEIRLDNLEELLLRELGQIRFVLDLPQDTELTFEGFEPVTHAWEIDPNSYDLDALIEKTPEDQQLVEMIEAAKVNSYSKVFSFISGASARNTATGIGGSENASFAFSKAQATGLFHFGFDYFTNIALADTDIEMLRARRKELKAETDKTAVTLIKTAHFVMDRGVRAEQSEALIQSVFESDKDRYSRGEVPLTQVIESLSGVREAALEKHRAATDLRLLRISLHRLTRSDIFANVTSCKNLPRVTEQTVIKPRFPWEKPKVLPAAVCDPASTAKKFGN